VVSVFRRSGAGSWFWTEIYDAELHAQQTTLLSATLTCYVAAHAMRWKELSSMTVSYSATSVRVNGWC